jgi:hypothetical protein
VKTYTKYTTHVLSKGNTTQQIVLNKKIIHYSTLQFSENFPPGHNVCKVQTSEVLKIIEFKMATVSLK